MRETTYKNTINKVGIITIIWNVILSIGKVFAGIFAKSNALISDGLHSISDVFSTIIVIIGAKVGKKEADKEHPFGHERLESVASILLAALLIITALGIGYNGVVSLINHLSGKEHSFNLTYIYIALGFAVGSIIIKGWMYFYTMKYAKKIGSNSLKADAYHHLTDSLSSIASSIGIVGMLIGKNLAILDPIASILISLFIVKIGVEIILNSFDELVDKAAPIEVQNKIKDLSNSYEKVLKVNSLKTRIFGNMYYVELEIAVDNNLTVKEGHEIAEGLHDLIESSIKEIKHCVIHIEPIDK